MALNTYLTFEDNCREAFEFYRSVFGGDFMTMTTFREGPEGMDIPEDELDRVMHVSLPVGDSVLMGSDSCSPFSPPPVVGNNFTINFEADSKSHADAIFEKISDGGEVIWPMEDVFWGAYFGRCCDKFGIHWQVLTDHASE